MDASEKIKGVLDGSIHPSEISGDTELYSMAERIYGRDALEEMGVDPPVTPPEGGLLYPNGNGGVEIPVSIDSARGSDNEMGKIPRRRFFIPLVMLFFLIVSSYNVAFGLGTVLPLCEEEEKIQELEMSSTSQINNGTLIVVWSMHGLNNYSEYTLEWRISQNGSSEVVEFANSSWISSETARINSKNWIIDTLPYSYLSTLYEDGLPVAYSNGSGDIITTLTTASDEGNYCEDNTRLIWSEYSDLGSNEAWGESGNGEILDGALMMLFALMMIISARKRV